MTTKRKAQIARVIADLDGCTWDGNLWIARMEQVRSPETAKAYLEAARTTLGYDAFAISIIEDVLADLLSETPEA